MEPDLSVTIGRITMKNPLTVASGTGGQGEVFEPFFDVNRLGFLTTKSVTLQMREGNPPPRIAETPAGCLNSIGLQNPGVDAFIREYRAFFEKLETPLVVSIAGHHPDEYAELARKLSGELPLAGLEINISCPNLERGGLQFACDPKAAASVVRAVRAATGLTLITKLTPNVEHNVEIGRACAEEGTDALAAINTLKGMAIHLETRRPRLGNVIGGLSGPAVKPVALRWVFELARHIPVPVVGMGGIASARDALEFIVAGASAVAVGTAHFFNPRAVPEMLEEMKEWLRRQGIPSIRALRQSVLLEPR
jgi:dihydroorotate dehydrogenase (NAD+) catalytic subunit